MAHSNLPQQLDLTAEHGVQIEVNRDRGVAYLHVDGYTACRVSFRGKPCEVEVTKDNNTAGLAFMAPYQDRIDIEKAAKFITGIIMTHRFLLGQESSIKLSGPDVDKVEQETIEQLRSL